MKELEKTYEPKKYEEDIYQNWEKSGYFNPDNLELPEGAEKYSIVMPPPNVTGVLHMGHAAMLAIEDIMIRFNRMKGRRTLWLPGTDHAAIATQTKVDKLLKEKGQDRHQLGREKFLEEVKKFASNSHDTIVNQLKKMGSSCDWDREAYTLDEVRTKAVRSVFKMMYDDGLIYRGERIVNWCPQCQSTLADDEVEYEEENGKLYWIKYGPFVLATARPETKLGDTAVAVHPSDKRYQEMVGKEYEIPGVLGSFKIKVVADRAVDPEFGSGAIKVTPAHSFIDNEIAQRHNLPSRKIIDENGRMMENCGKYAGMTTQEARQAIVADMEKMGLIDHIEENYRHNISVCYRCGSQIEPLPSLQWFIDVNKKIERLGNKSIKDLCIEAVRSGVFGREKIKIVPQRFEKNYFNWIENLRDWCVSRQILFGHQIPVWYKNDEIYVGVESPQDSSWKQDSDTLDTWFSSGLWTFSTLSDDPDQISIADGKLKIDSDDFRSYHPTSVLETGYDILFFWVARMIIMTTYAVGDIPFQDIYLHGLVLDEKGKKMSKSKGNTIDPLDMIDKFGTDATRLSLVIGSTPGNDMRLSEEKIAGYRNFTNKLWNISRYIAGNFELANSNADLDPKKLTLADRWILEEMRDLIREVSSDLENYNFSQAGEKLKKFTWNYLADWYLEASKFEKDGAKEKILAMILKDLLKLWHPFMPFVTEKIWQLVEDGKLLMVQPWPEAKSYEEIVSKDKHSESDFNLIRQAIIAIRNSRAEMSLPPSDKIEVVIYAHDKKELFESQRSLIENLRTVIEKLDIQDNGEKIKKSFFINIGKVEIYIPLEGLIDIEKEKSRFQKELAQAEKYFESLKKKLSNKQFAANAPKEIVAQEEEKLRHQEIKIEKIKNHIESLE